MTQAVEEKKKYTEEQSAFLKALIEEDYSVLKIDAVPGAGKTFIAKESIKKVICSDEGYRQIVYLAFNGSMVRDVKPELAKIGAECRTLHSLINREFAKLKGIPRSRRLENSTDNWVISFDGDKANWESLNNRYYQVSKDRKEGYKHQPSKHVLKDVLQSFSRLPHDIDSFCARALEDEGFRVLLSEKYLVTETHIKYFNGFYKWLIKNDYYTHDMYVKCFTYDYPDAVITYDYIFVDEAQDTNTFFVRLLRDGRINATKKLILIGDSNQRIYNWNLLSASEDALKSINGQFFELTTSFRMTAEACQYANRVNKIRRKKNSLIKPGNTDEMPPIPSILYCHRSNAGVLQDALRFAVLPEFQYTKIELLSNKDKTDININILKFFYFLMASSEVSRTRDFAEEFARAHKLFKEGYKKTAGGKLQLLLNAIAKATREGEIVNINDIFEDIIEKEKDGEEVSYIQIAGCKSVELDKDLVGFYRLYRSYRDKRELSYAISRLKYSMQLSDDHRKIHIGTAHSSKGLEFDIVYVRGKGWSLWTELEANAFYVAITRGRHKVILEESQLDMIALYEDVSKVLGWKIGDNVNSLRDLMIMYEMAKIKEEEEGYSLDDMEDDVHIVAPAILKGIGVDLEDNSNLENDVNNNFVDDLDSLADKNTSTTNSNAELLDIEMTEEEWEELTTF